jgi:hypothetical protein
MHLLALYGSLRGLSHDPRSYADATARARDVALPLHDRTAPYPSQTPTREPPRHDRTCSGHPRLEPTARKKAWMPATGAGMTVVCRVPVRAILKCARAAGSVS